MFLNKKIIQLNKYIITNQNCRKTTIKYYPNTKYNYNNNK